MGLVVEGIAQNYRLCAPELEWYKPVIGKLLEELPDPFRATEGGGWSFLNAYVDRHGRQWTDHHRDMEMLFVLGIATDQAAWLTPREIWPSLPGGMPFVVVYVRC